jgi:hypothetical protein
VGGGEGAELLGERDLTGVVEVILAAEEDDLVGEQRRADRGHRLLPEVRTEADAVDAGADPAAEAVHGHGLGSVDADGHGASR